MKAISVPAGVPAQPAELMEINQPVYQPNLITVRTLYTGVCATDAPYLKTQSDPRTPESRLFPTIAFHEVVAEVIHSGRESLAIPEGTIVVPLVRRCQERTSSGTFTPCRFIGSCPQAGRPDRCPRRSKYMSRGTGKNSGFGSQFWTDEGMWLVQVPSEVLKKLRDDKYLCVLAEPMSISQKAVRLANNLRRTLVDEPNPFLDNVLVVGLGPIGLLAVLALKEQSGYRRIYGADTYDEDNIRARILQDTPSFGLGLEGQYIQVPKKEPDEATEEENFYTSWIDDNRDRLGEVNEGRFQIIIEATGRPDVVSDLIPALAPDGVIVVLGIPDNDEPVNIPGSELSTIVSQNKVLTGCVNASKEDLITGLWCIADCYEKYTEAVKRLVTEDDYTNYNLNWLNRHVSNRKKEIKASIKW